jgi:hypothetical protein
MKLAGISDIHSILHALQLLPVQLCLEQDRTCLMLVMENLGR